jgi:hypothetical protein
VLDRENQSSAATIASMLGLVEAEPSAMN